MKMKTEAVTWKEAGRTSREESRLAHYAARRITMRWSFAEFAISPIYSGTG